ncbi:MAG TPA: hypothetical protein VN256_25980 [Pyrinomonadaceae bacterium]|nr:hypothetical protein [Pyrinomonadaceae bacterium]
MTKQGFRKLVVLHWLLVITGVAVSLATERFLPAELRAYLHARENDAFTQGRVVLDVIGVLFIIFTVALSVGLFRFRLWAKKLLPLSYVLGILLIPAMGANVQTGWASLTFYLCSLVDGVILALVYFSPLKEEFELSRVL